MSQTSALIIDDNVKNVNVLARMLSNEGMGSYKVTNPKFLDAELEKADEVSVVFLDLEMPGMDGYQVLNKLKADKRFSEVPIVAYTVHVSEIHTAHKNGFDGFIGKPLDSDRFPNQLSRIMEGQGVWELP